MKLTPEIQEMLPNLAYGAISVWLLNKLWDIGSGSHKKLVESNANLVVALVELKIELKGLKEIISEIPRIRGDVNEAHAKIRELRAEQRRP